MTVPGTPVSRSDAETQSDAAAADVDAAPPTPAAPSSSAPPSRSASRSTSLSGSCRDGLGLAEGLAGGFHGVDEEDRLLFGSHGLDRLGASTPMKEIMDGATVPTLPRYIFKAHEMTQNVRNLLEDCPHTDVVLVAADEELPAHSKVLKEFGGNLFAMVEEAPEGRALLPDMSGEVLLEVLRFAYTGAVPAAGRMPRALLAAAHRAGLPELKGRCAEVLVQRLDVHNVTEMFELADKNGEERLKQAAAVLFLDNAKEVYDTEEWHASLDLRPAAAMRLVHIAVTKTSLDAGSVGTGTRIVHLIARIYMVAIVPVVGYVLYASVRNRIRAARGLDANTTATSASGVVAEVVAAAVNHSVAAATGLGGADDDFFVSPNDEL